MTVAQVEQVNPSSDWYIPAVALQTQPKVVLRMKGETQFEQDTPLVHWAQPGEQVVQVVPVR